MGFLYVCLGMLFGYVSVWAWGQALCSVWATVINARGLAIKNCDKRPHHSQKILRQSQDRDNMNRNVVSVVYCFVTIFTLAQFFCDDAVFLKIFDIYFLPCDAMLAWYML